ncbi:MAG: hypothetical protein LIO96_13160 [Lachnospiraceae bacterium]|nr:hypothetical protein [Lachnospiraceae bacterium]
MKKSGSLGKILPDNTEEHEKIRFPGQEVSIYRKESGKNWAKAKVLSTSRFYMICRLQYKITLSWDRISEPSQRKNHNTISTPEPVKKGGSHMNIKTCREGITLEDAVACILNQTKKITRT